MSNVYRFIASLFRSRLVKASSSSFLIRLSYTGITFVTSVIFARIFGVEGLGIYTYAVTVANVLSIPATLGFKQVLIKHVAIYNAQGEWQKLKGLLLVSSAAGLAISLSLAIGLIGFFYSRGDGDATLGSAIAIALINLPFEAIRKLRLASLVGLDQTTKAFLPEFTIGPSLLLLTTLGVYALNQGTVSVMTVLQIKVVITVLTFVLGAYWLHQALPKPYHQAKPQFLNREWFGMAFPLSLAEGCGIMNSRLDILMLGAISGPETAGIYSVVTRGTSLIQLVTQAVFNVIPPKMATLYADGNYEKLRALCQKSTRLLLVLSVAIATVITIFGPSFLTIFGKDFTAGFAPLLVLSLEKAVLVFATSASYLLMMSGHERTVFKSDFLGLMSNVILNFLLISRYGVVGAAIATTISSTMVASAKSLAAYKSLGIRLV
ncbi:MAG: flippase [Cyanobacteria bacterium P01_G01_bin.38]